MTKDRVQAPGAPAWKILLAFVVLIMCCGATVWFSTITADNPADESPIGFAPAAVSVGQEIPTQTGLAPFEVSIPDDVIDTPIPTLTRTPKPTFISDNRTFDPVIQYETQIVVQYVTQIVTVVHTSIPEATWTPQPTDNVYQTAAANLQAQNNADRQLSRTWGYLAITVVSIIMIILIAITVLVLFKELKDWWQNKTGLVEETAEEITAPAMSAVDGVTANQYRTIRLMWAQGHSRREIESEVFGYTGGAAHDKVGLVIEHIEWVKRNSPTPAA